MSAQTAGRLWLTNKLVGVRGLEPPTSASRTLRAADCATPRKYDNWW